LLTEKGGLVSKIGGQVIRSLALAGSLLYSNLAYSQDKPVEQPQEPVAQEPETPKESKSEVPEKKPKEVNEKAAKDPEPKLIKLPESYFSLHLKGGASPNGDSQASHGFSELNFSLKEMLKGNLFLAYNSSSFIDKNDVRTIVNNPLTAKLDLDSMYEGVRMRLGFRVSEEETIRRNSDYSSTQIGTSLVEVLTRSKTVDRSEHYGGLLQFEHSGLAVILEPYLSLFPTTNEHEITQIVTDPNPSASYQTNFTFRDPTARNQKVGALVRAGHTKKLKDGFYLVSDLVGILEQQTLEFSGYQKREIQRIHVGLDAFLQMPILAPRVFIGRGFLDDKLQGERNAHSENSTKFLASLYFDTKVLKEIKSEDEKGITTKKTGFPAMGGLTFISDHQYGAGDRYTNKSLSAVLGFGNASGKEALSAIASIEEDLALKKLGLRPGEGQVLSKAHSIWQAYQRPFKLANPSTYGLLLTGNYSTERLNSVNNILYGGQAYAILDSLILNAGISKNKDTRDNSWNAGIGYFVKDWFFLGADYTESKLNDGRTGTYSAGARILIK